MERDEADDAAYLAEIVERLSRAEDRASVERALAPLIVERRRRIQAERDRDALHALTDRMQERLDDADAEIERLTREGDELAAYMIDECGLGTP